MDQTPLVIDEIEAGKEFIKRLNAYQPVKAAYWLREEEGERYLYAVLDALTDDNTGAAYREVRRITQEMKDHYVDPFRVKVVRSDDPVARAVLGMYCRFPGRRPPSTFSAAGLGVPVAVVDSYIYPPLAPGS